MSSLTIGGIAKRAHVNIETVRYYQRVGIIDEPIKPNNGFRVYKESTVERILFVKRAQQLGFKLSEIKELLNLGDESCLDVKQIALEKRKKITSQLKDLNSMKKELDILINACEIGSVSNICGLVKTLAKISYQDC